jgi:vacuolar-type H+-ATPase subunit H
LSGYGNVSGNAVQMRSQIEANSEQKLQEMMYYFMHQTDIPFLGTLVSTKKMETFFEELKATIIGDLDESKRIQEVRARILQDAKKEADDIVRRARDEVEKVDVMQQAREYARDIVQEAQRNAEGMLQEAQEIQYQLVLKGHEYLDHLFEGMENRLKLKNSLENKIKELKSLG